MKMMDTETLKNLMVAYLNTLDDDREHEYYATRRDLAIEPLDGFYDWLTRMDYEIVEGSRVYKGYVVFPDWPMEFVAAFANDALAQEYIDMLKETGNA